MKKSQKVDLRLTVRRKRSIVPVMIAPRTSWRPERVLPRDMDPRRSPVERVKPHRRQQTWGQGVRRQGSVAQVSGRERGRDMTQVGRNRRHRPATARRPGGKAQSGRHGEWREGRRDSRWRRRCHWSLGLCRRWRWCWRCGRTWREFIVGLLWWWRSIVGLGGGNGGRGLEER